MEAIQRLSPEEKARLCRVLQEKERFLRENKAEQFQPWPWQTKFIAKTKDFNECAAWKANRMGGTLIAMYTARTWATGKYPPWWTGRVFDKPTRGVVVGADYNQIKRASQKILAGMDVPDWGVGEIGNPYPVLGRADIEKVSMNTVIRGLIDTVFVKHVTGGFSTITFMAHTQSEDTLMGDELDWVIFDEFPRNEKLYNQAIPRIETTNGNILVFATPEHGRNAATDRYLIEQPKDPTTGKGITYYEFVHKRENPNLSEEDLKRIIAQCPVHERPFRIEGKPVIGEGSIFGSVLKENMSVNWNLLPNFDTCKHIVGFDMGFQDYGALVWLMHEPYSDKAYIWHSEEVRYQTAAQIARIYEAVNRQFLDGFNPPLAWGWDAACIEMTSGDSLLNQLRREGVNCCPVRAHNALLNDKSNNIRPRILEMYNRMETKRLFGVDNHLMGKWWNERDLYCWVDGKVIKKREMRFNLMDASQYALMMLPFAQFPSDSHMKKRLPEFSETSFSRNNHERTRQYVQ